MRSGAGPFRGRLGIGPRTRLALFVVALVGVFLLAADRAPAPERIRGAIEPFGWAAPLAFLVASIALHATFVPGPLLAGASGLLFGAVLGTFVTLVGSICSALVELSAAAPDRRAPTGSAVSATTPWLDGSSATGSRRW